MSYRILPTAQEDLRSIRTYIAKDDPVRGVPYISISSGRWRSLNATYNRERTMAGLRAARARGRTGGRPRSLSEEDLPEVQALMRDPDVPVRRICERFDISKATLYRYVGPGGEQRLACGQREAYSAFAYS